MRKESLGLVGETSEYIGFTRRIAILYEYDDVCDKDERLWAARNVCCKLRRKYKNALEELSKENLCKTDFGWTDVSGLASMAILTDAKKQTPENFAKNFVILFWQKQTA